MAATLSVTGPAISGNKVVSNKDVTISWSGWKDTSDIADARYVAIYKYAYDDRVGGKNIKIGETNVNDEVITVNVGSNDSRYTRLIFVVAFLTSSRIIISNLRSSDYTISSPPPPPTKTN